MKNLIVILFFSLTVVTYGQERYALVIGNSNYTNFGTLRNPVNDANDMEATLRSLGFTVDKVINGSLSQMENATIRLRNRLTEAGNNAYGFFYYAGHGLELGGVNYLIPADANIPDRNFLRERAFSVQIMLDMLNDSRNALNIVVLDACRDFPAVWSRSLNRGLAIIANPPANHIIMYATGAGTIANDGTGRNGLFTGHLLNNLQQPGIEVNEIFRRTMGDVAEASHDQQRPALYTDFARTVYFGSRPTIAQPAQPQPVQEQPVAQPAPAQPAQEQSVVYLEPTIINWPSNPKTANIRDNWFSVEFGGGIGPKYERMLSPKISFGAFAYWSPLYNIASGGFNIMQNCFGIEAAFRIYPWGKTFFLGSSLGLYYLSYSDNYKTYYGDAPDEYGLAITPEIGWKIDVGKAGGFYFQPGFGISVLFGGNLPSITRLNLGVGYAF